MKIIFLGKTGIHHTLIAAYLFLGYEIYNNLQKYPGFADIDKENSGFPILVGQDKFENMIYSLGCETDILLVKKAIEELTLLLGSEPEELKVLPISIPDENILLLLNKIAEITGAGKWYYWISRFITKRYLGQIFNRVIKWQDEMAKSN